VDVRRTAAIGLRREQRKQENIGIAEARSPSKRKERGGEVHAVSAVAVDGRTWCPRASSLAPLKPSPTDGRRDGGSDAPAAAEGAGTHGKKDAKRQAARVGGATRPRSLGWSATPPSTSNAFRCACARTRTQRPPPPARPLSLSPPPPSLLSKKSCPSAAAAATALPSSTSRTSFVPHAERADAPPSVTVKPGAGWWRQRRRRRRPRALFPILTGGLFCGEIAPSAAGKGGAPPSARPKAHTHAATATVDGGGGEAEQSREGLFFSLRGAAPPSAALGMAIVLQRAHQQPQQPQRRLGDDGGHLLSPLLHRPLFVSRRLGVGGARAAYPASADPSSSHPPAHVLPRARVRSSLLSLRVISPVAPPSSAAPPAATPS